MNTCKDCGGAGYQWEGVCGKCWQQRCERAEACCAEMRPIVEEANEQSKLYPEHEGRFWHALSTDCGKDYVPRAKLDKAQAAQFKAEISCALWSARFTRYNSMLANGIKKVDTKEVAKCVTDTIEDTKDCGKGWVSPEEFKRVQDAAEKQTLTIVELQRKLTLAMEALKWCVGNCGGYVLHKANEALAAIEKGQG